MNDWLFVRPSVSQRFLMRVYATHDWMQDNWKLLSQGALAALYIALLCVVGFGLYAVGLVRGSALAEGCALDHGQQSIAVLGFRDAQGQLHCQYRMNPFHVPRIKG